MALPPGFVDELKTRLSLASVVGRKVTWDSRKSNPGKGDYWSPCPFHQEKTASFHVDDRKGYYYCFGCHAKGDAVNFVRETENMDFMEAVELLAGEAGMPVPKASPAEAKRAAEAASLGDIMDMAVTFYRRQMRGALAGPAREYLAGRGLDAEAIDRFEIGFAGGARDGLVQHLRGKDVPAKDIDRAGLSLTPDGGGAPYDRFRDRIMYPIRDARGRAIAFGGRAMSADAKAKYLNSPETPLFKKGSALYHHGPAREAAGKTGRLIVAEGYMDVIALATQGFAESVAPLGTAITEDQLRLFWRMADEPVIALDGDKAGLRAAMRLVDVALPLLEAGKSLRFCLLPEGQDPDDLLRQSGAEAMEAHLRTAVPLFELLWRRETEAQPVDSPERRAAFDARLRTVLGTIQDPTIRAHYEAEVRQKRRALFAPPRPQSTYTRTQSHRPGKPGKRRAPWFEPDPRPTGSAKASPLAGQSASDASHVRATIIVALAVNNPGAAAIVEQQLENLPMRSPLADRVRSGVLAALAGGWGEPDGPPLENFVDESLLNSLLGLGHVATHPYMRPDVDQSKAAQVLEEAMNLHRAAEGMANEIEETVEEAADAIDEGVRRLGAAKRAVESAASGRIDATDLMDEDFRATTLKHWDTLIERND